MNTKSRLIYIPADGDEIQADLRIPEDSKAIVIFAHGSGSSRHSPRNQYVAGVLNDGRIATLLIDLLTPDEEWWILKLRSSDSTSICWLNGCRSLRIGCVANRQQKNSTSAISAPVPAQRRPSSPLRNIRRLWKPSFRAGPARFGGTTTGQRARSNPADCQGK